MSDILMACGHRAQAHTETGAPACVICHGNPAALQIAPEPNLTGRMAKCSCGNTRRSSVKLPFFEYRGPGSPAAVDHCQCGYHKKGHDKPRHSTAGWCANFTPHDPWEFDLYYCGCRGWD